MDKIVPRTRGPRVSQQIYRLIYLAQKEMTRTQRMIIKGYERSCGLSRVDFSSWRIAASG